MSGFSQHAINSIHQAANNTTTDKMVSEVYGSQKDYFEYAQTIDFLGRISRPVTPRPKGKYFNPFISLWE